MDAITENRMLFHALIGAGIVLVFVLLSRVVRSILGMVGRRLLAKTQNVLDDRILEVILRFVRPAMLLIGLQIGLREIRKGLVPADLTLLQIHEYADAVLYVATVLLVVRIMLNILREVVGWYLDRISAEGASNLKMTLGPLTNKVNNILIGFVAVIVILDHFSINIGSLLVSLGVGSLAVALAAQDTLANMIAGFVILVDRPFRVGDRIELPTGQVGDVKEIGLRSTRVMNFDNNMIVLPNAELVKGRIVNFSYPHQPMRVLLRFDVAHDTDPEAVRAILLGLASRRPMLMSDPAPAVYMTAVTENGIQMTLMARCASFEDQFAEETTLREQAYAAFRKEGIDVAVVRREITMTRGA
jgi:MscS family membrane protein